MWLSSSSKRAVNRKSTSPRQQSKSPSTPRPTSPTSALAEVLRKNPFRASSKDSLPINEDEDSSVALNRDLQVLADFFPDVKTEVLREVLLRFDGDSRLPISIEQLYKYKTEWAKGRMNVPPRGSDEDIPPDELFRTRQYIDSVKWTITKEFNVLGKSVIDAVLAEVNFSYPHARPTLQALASRSWKVTLTNLLKKKRLPTEIPPALLEKSKDGPSKLILTGDDELDQELSDLFNSPFQPIRQSRDFKKSDFALAQALNLQEAEEAGALHECQVCFNEVTFESVSYCSNTTHAICLNCVRRALDESLFGQGWGKSIDVQHGTVKCVAAVDCDGHIAQDLVKLSLALRDERSSTETWKRFEDRLAEHNLQHASLVLVRCPYCSYAEAEDTYGDDSAGTLQWHIRRPTTFTQIIMCVFLLELVPATFIVLLPLLIFFPKSFPALFYTSLRHIATRSNTTRFVCKSPSCSRKSCMKCQKAWHDPHVCHEPLILSLRKSVEAARTAAIKRVCPRCGTSFVKMSGCNKLTCVCGYSMCYLCRKNIGKAGNNDAGGEGYRHFCEHFRPVPGQQCHECNKCDLYKAEDEDVMVKNAGEEAERQWREKEGMVGVKGLETAVGNVGGEDTPLKRFLQGDWSVQGISDWAVDSLVIVKVR
jgi:hypothetical protein